MQYYSFLIFIFLLKREYVQAGQWGRERERQREREKENLKQAPCSVQSLTQGLIPQPWDHQESVAQPTEPLRCPYSLFKKKEILTFVTTWMNLEYITISEICQKQKDK